MKFSVLGWFPLLFACARPPAPTSPGAEAPNASVTDGDKYRVLFENECVRLLEYRDHPGDKTHQHHHPDFVLYALAPFRRRLTFPDGKQVERAFRAGEFASMKAQTHVGENVGEVDTAALLVELKDCTPPRTD